MFSLHVFSATTTNATNFANLAPLADPAISITGNFMTVPALNNILGVYALGANLSRSLIQSPSLFDNVPHEIRSLDPNILPTSPIRLQMFEKTPLKLTVNDQLQAKTIGTASGVQSVYVLLGDGPATPVTGDIARERFTFTTSATADSWQNAAITLDDTLPVGTYQVVGMRLQGAHLKAGRLVFPGSSNSIRPGCIATQNKQAVQLPDIFTGGQLGVWGTFDSRVLPTIDHITDGNSETAVGYFDLIKTA